MSVPVETEEPYSWHELGGAYFVVAPPEFVDAHCHPLMDPRMIPASEASHMRDDDVVLGLSLGGEARAYPWFIMDGHHVANDTVAGQHVLISLCEACCTGVAYDPVLEGQRLTFYQPYVFNGTTALRDQQTGSAWSTYFGRAIRGSLEGTLLDGIPICHMEWGDWRKLHPDTLVLPDEPGSREGHGSECTIEAEWVAEEFKGSTARWDTRLAHYALVLGVITPTAQRAYPLDLLRRQDGVISDEIGGVPMVALLHVARGSYAALAFSRELDGRTLTFERRSGKVIDRETESEWTVEGRAISGPLVGRELTWINSHVSKWYLWPAHFPDIDVAKGPTSERQ